MVLQIDPGKKKEMVARIYERGKITWKRGQRA